MNDDNPSAVRGAGYHGGRVRERRGARLGVTNPRAGEQGFTLIELHVDVAGVGGRGRSTASQTNLESVQTVVLAYNNDNGDSYPTSGGSLAGTVVLADLVPICLHTAPTTTGARVTRHQRHRRIGELLRGAGAG